MKIIVLGCGNIGRVAAEDIAENLPLAEVVMADVDENRAREAASQIRLKNINWAVADATNHMELASTLMAMM